MLGDNTFGQLGTTLPDDNTTSNVPVEVSGLSNVIQITAGNAHICAVLSTGAMKCWGDGSSGVLGQGSTTDNRNTPVSVVNSTSGTPTAVDFGTSWHTSTCFKSASAATYSCDLD